MELNNPQYKLLRLTRTLSGRISLSGFARYKCFISLRFVQGCKRSQKTFTNYFNGLKQFCWRYSKFDSDKKNCGRPLKLFGNVWQMSLQLFATLYKPRKNNKIVFATCTHTSLFSEIRTALPHYPSVFYSACLCLGVRLIHQIQMTLICSKIAKAALCEKKKSQSQYWEEKKNT